MCLPNDPEHQTPLMNNAEDVAEKVLGNRPYHFVEGREAIQKIHGFQLEFNGHGLENPDERAFVNQLNGGISNLCDKALGNLPGALRNGSLLPDIIKLRPSWIELLRDEAKDFLLTKYNVIECTRDMSNRLGKIQSSITHIIDSNKIDTKFKLQNLSDECMVMRQRLLEIGAIRQDRRRFLHVAAGAIAFVSGSTMLTQAQIPHELLIVLSALLAFSSSLVTLVTSTYYDEKDITSAFEGAARYLSLSIDADLEKFNNKLSDSEAFKKLDFVQRSYGELAKTYDRILAIGVAGKPDSLDPTRR